MLMQHFGGITKSIMVFLKMAYWRASMLLDLNSTIPVDVLMMF